MSGAARQLCFFASGERDSAIEHMVHVVKLQNVESQQFKRRPGDFEASAPSSAMLTKQERRHAAEQARIERENKILIDKIESQTRYAAKLQHEALEKIRKQKATFAGSNIHRRTLEARKIDHDNRMLGERLAAAKSYVPTRSDIAVSSRDYEHTRTQLSKFKPSPVLPQPPRKLHADDEGGAAGSSTVSHPASARRWQPINQHDIKASETARDRRLKGHPPISPRLSTMQRTHNPSQWCDRESAHKQHVQRVRQMQAEEAEGQA